MFFFEKKNQKTFFSLRGIRKVYGRRSRAVAGTDCAVDGAVAEASLTGMLLSLASMS
jgi:hypothetical protein